MSVEQPLVPAEVPRRRDAARAQALDDGQPRCGSGAGQARSARGAARVAGGRRAGDQPRLEHARLTPSKVTNARSRRVDSATETAPRSAGRRRLTSAMPSARSVRGVLRADGADGADAQAESRGGDGGDHRAAAGMPWSATRTRSSSPEPRQAREAGEDEVVERLADGQQVHAAVKARGFRRIATGY